MAAGERIESLSKTNATNNDGKRMRALISTLVLFLALRRSPWTLALPLASRFCAPFDRLASVTVSILLTFEWRASIAANKPIVVVASCCSSVICPLSCASAALLSWGGRKQQSRAAAAALDRVVFLVVASC